MKARVIQRIKKKKKIKQKLREEGILFGKHIERSRCTHVGRGVGHDFTNVFTLAHFLWEIDLQILFLHPLLLPPALCSHPKKRSRLHRALGLSPETVHEGMAAV